MGRNRGEQTIQAEVGVGSREKDGGIREGPAASTAHMWKDGKGKSQNQYGLPHEHGSIERRECRPMRLVI
jgi:hypothetical protein